MKYYMIAGSLSLAFSSLVATADAATVTTGSADFHAVNAADQSKLEYDSFNGYVENTSTASPGYIVVTAAVKRQPASSADGSQTVSVGFNLPGPVNFTGIITSVDNTGSIFAQHGFWIASSDYSAASDGYVTKTVTFSASEISSSSYYIAQINLVPNTYVYGAYAN
jgi:hypothetical protein